MCTIAVLVGIVVLITGYLIKYREWTFLIAGYDTSVDVPPAVAGDIVGSFTIRAGVAVVALGVITAVVTLSDLLVLILTGILVIGVIRVIYRLRTYPTQNSQ